MSIEKDEVVLFEKFLSSKQKKLSYLRHVLSNPRRKICVIMYYVKDWRNQTSEKSHTHIRFRLGSFLASQRPNVTWIGGVMPMK